YTWGKAHDVKVVALTVAPWGGFKRYFNPSRAEATRTVNAWIREQPKAGHVDFVIDAYALLSCGDSERLCDRFVEPFRDGIHFGPKAPELLARPLYRGLFSACECGASPVFSGRSINPPRRTGECPLFALLKRARATSEAKNPKVRGGARERAPAKKVTRRAV